jgi:galactitol-specific phosphotransferase system IIC component
MRSHFAMLVLFAVMVSTVFAVLQKDSAREQIRLGLMMASAFVGFGLVVGWMMLAFPLW